jgi:hypothetical protein
MNLTEALYDKLAGDPTLVGLLATYNGAPSIFTIDPAPEGADLPFIVAAGHVVDLAWDTKTTRGRDVWRDIRCYSDADGSAITVEAIAERVRALLHRTEISVTGFTRVVAECSGPVAADEQDAYGRVVTVRYVLEE